MIVTLSEEMQTDMTAASTLTGHMSVEEAAFSGHTVTEVIPALSESKGPLILMGGSGWSQTGRVALQEFAEGSDLPVLAAFRFRDPYDNHSPTYFDNAAGGMIPATKQHFRNADLILAVNVSDWGDDD